MAYTKLFNSIVTSTIWSEDDKTRIVWITMLAIADKNGEVQGSVPGLARIAGVPVDDCRIAIAKFLSPDPDSRTKDDEGRRIEEIDGGWSLLNHQKYREMASKDEQREAEAKRKARYRDKIKRNEKSQNVPDMSQEVPKNSHIAEADTKAEKKNKRTSQAMPRPSLEEIAEYGRTLDPPFTKAGTFISHYESNGWKVGKNPMKDWKAAVRTWQQKDKQTTPTKPRPINEEFTYQKNGQSQHRPLWD
jgi:hypothetical protein